MPGLRDTDPLGWLTSCEEIRQLAHRYAVGMNHRNLDAVVALFVHDVQVGADRWGRDALRADFEDRLRPLGRTILQVTNQVIDVHDTTRASGVVGTRAEIELDGEWIVQVIEYHDTYARSGAGAGGPWRFVRRDHRLWYGAPVGTSPIGLPPANWPERAVGTGDLPQSLDSWRAWRR